MREIADRLGMHHLTGNKTGEVAPLAERLRGRSASGRDLAAIEARATVPFLALEREHAAIATELREAFDRVVAHRSLTLGQEVERFESEFAEHCAVRCCVGVASGTAALTIALIAAGVSSGDEVIVPAHTHISSALAVAQAGATVVFCDVDPSSGLIDIRSAAAAVSPRTVAIMAVHLYGQACEMEEICTLARTHQLLVVEDAAHAHGARFRGRPVGGLGDVAAFSFSPAANLGALGDGGAICTDDPDIAERARQLRNLGQRQPDEHVVLGYNERLDELQAALLRVKLSHLDAANRKRRLHASSYRSELADDLLLSERAESPCVYHVFPILLANRDEAATALARAGIATAVHYSRTAADQALWGRPPAAEDELPVARYWAAHELSLPLFPELTHQELQRVIGACAELGYVDSSSLGDVDR